MLHPSASLKHGRLIRLGNPKKGPRALPVHAPVAAFRFVMPSIYNAMRPCECGVGNNSWNVFALTDRQIFACALCIYAEKPTLALPVHTYHAPFALERSAVMLRVRPIARHWRVFPPAVLNELGLCAPGAQSQCGKKEPSATRLSVDDYMPVTKHGREPLRIDGATGVVVLWSAWGRANLTNAFIAIRKCSPCDGRTCRRRTTCS